jgi:hypothetical protein
MKLPPQFKYILLFFVFQCVLIQPSARAQQNGPPDRVVEDVSEVWSGYFMKYQLGERLFYYGDYQLRRINFLSDWSQILIRPGITYMLDKYAEVTLGGAYFANFTEPGPNQFVVPEWRLWQQLLLVQNVSRVKIYHQFRYEQRFFRRANDEQVLPGFESPTTRFRYRFTTYIPITSPNIQPGTIFFAGYDELMINTGRQFVYNIFDQNRIFLGLGYVLNANLQFQLGYLHLFQQRSAGNVYRNSNMLRFNIYHYVDLRRDGTPKNRAPVNRKQ